MLVSEVAGTHLETNINTHTHTNETKLGCIVIVRAIVRYVQDMCVGGFG